ncbi:MAG TPA: electron transfer flavoprotein-ubiquinone oxidoreductase [Aestuariivirga sp.]|nr:electron transfer flavoprotein-ubiquinone oxidoreductase [Aestuariivirga sp.]
MEQAVEQVEREGMDYDVVIVGAGPSGLAAAIRLKQLSPDTTVCVLEKGSEVGAHILSGAVIDPIALTELIPDWKEKDAPLKTAVKEDRFFLLGKNWKIRLPNWTMPRFMDNHGKYAVSLGNVCRWLATQAEAVGVEIYPGFAASELLTRADGSIRGVVAGVMGLARDGSHKADYQPGMELRGKYVLLAEGARGSLSRQVIQRFNLSEGREPQKFGLGMKELWEVKPEKHKPGQVTHTMGWPLDGRTGGGSFMYHLEDNLVSVGFVVHLNYENPHLFPYMEFQRFKHHPLIAEVLEGGRRVAYGARALTEGGLQSVPKLPFPGGALLGCAAGFMNVPRIKGSHNAMKSGMLAAEAAHAALQAGREGDELSSYQAAYEHSWIYDDLRKVKNVKPMWSRLGLWGGLSLGGLDMWLQSLFGFGLGTWKHGKADWATLKPASECPKIDYPKPDGVLSFDRLTNVAFSATNHEEDEPCHLVLADPSIPVAVNLPKWDEPAQRYCPAGVYEIVTTDKGEKRFQINAQNCVHCKTCDIKDPSQNITWVVPQGGEGPNYPNM